MTYGWRVAINATHRFAFDEVEILLARRSPEGLQVVAPAEIVLGEASDPLVQTEQAPAPFLTLPRDAVEALFEALAGYLLGTSDVVRLTRDLAAERKRVDALIAGIGRTGGVT